MTDEEIQVIRKAVVTVRVMGVLAVVGLIYGAMNFGVVGLTLSAVFLLGYSAFTYSIVKDEEDLYYGTDKFDKLGYSILCSLLFLGAFLFVLAALDFVF